MDCPAFFIVYVTSLHVCPLEEERERMKVRQARPFRGRIKVPGDKSISHRAVMLGALAEGETTISGFLPGADCLSTIDCFRKLGVKVEQSGDLVRVFGRGWYGLQEPTETLNVGNSGTTIRLLAGILATQPFHCVLEGDHSIAKRPMKRIVDPLRQMGAQIDGRNGGEYTPLSIRGGTLKGVEFHSPIASAQVKSAVLLAGLQAEGQTTVIEPIPTRDHTERMLRAFGAEVFQDGCSVTVTGGQRLFGRHITVPGDLSSAAFLIAAALLVPDSTLIVEGVGINPTRTGIFDVLKAMGASISVENQRTVNEEPIGDIVITSSSLRGTVVEGEIIPRLIDEIPILAVLATQAEGITIIRNAEELRVKESNRIEAMASQLKKMGASITPLEDGLMIEGGTPLCGAVVDSLGDHRVGMALAIAGLVAKGETEILQADAFQVSFPGFSAFLEQLFL